MTELAASSPADRVNQLIRLTTRLTALLDEETAYFEAHQPRKALPLQDEKSKLTAIYRRESQLAAKDRTRLDAAPEPDRAALREATKAFEAALTRNGAAVEALMRLSEGLVKAIADEALRQRTANAGYGPGAARTASLGSLTLDNLA